MAATSAHVQAPPNPTNDPLDNTQYTRLKDYLTDWQHPLEDIRTRLNDQQLTDAEARKLFGSIRKSVLDIIWRHRHLEIWIFRCTRMGCEYAQGVAEEVGVEADPNRYCFYREQDDELDMRGGTRYEVVEMTMQHVGVYREGTQGVERLQNAKGRMLEAERR